MANGCVYECGWVWRAGIALALVQSVAAGTVNKTLRVDHGRPVVVVSQRSVLLLEFFKEPISDALVSRPEPDVRHCRARYRFQCYDGATGSYAMASGVAATAAGKGGVAMGHNAVAGADDTIALGSGAAATAQGGVALGQGAQADRAGMNRTIFLPTATGPYGPFSMACTPGCRTKGVSSNVSRRNWPATGSWL